MNKAQMFEAKDAYLKAKKAYQEKGEDPETFKATKEVFHNARQTIRRREIADGTREDGVTVGGDAFLTDPATYHGPEDAPKAKKGK